MATPWTKNEVELLLAFVQERYFAEGKTNPLPSILTESKKAHFSGAQAKVKTRTNDQCFEKWSRLCRTYHLIHSYIKTPGAIWDKDVGIQLRSSDEQDQFNQYIATLEPTQARQLRQFVTIGWHYWPQMAHFATILASSKPAAPVHEVSPSSQAAAPSHEVAPSSQAATLSCEVAPLSSQATTSSCELDSSSHVSSSSCKVASPSQVILPSHRVASKSQAILTSCEVIHSSFQPAPSYGVVPFSSPSQFPPQFAPFASQAAPSTFSSHDISVAMAENSLAQATHDALNTLAHATQDVPAQIQNLLGYANPQCVGPAPAAGDTHTIDGQLYPLYDDINQHSDHSSTHNQTFDNRFIAGPASSFVGSFSSPAGHPPATSPADTDHISDWNSTHMASTGRGSSIGEHAVPLPETSLLRVRNERSGRGAQSSPYTRGTPAISQELDEVGGNVVSPVVAAAALHHAVAHLCNVLDRVPQPNQAQEEPPELVATRRVSEDQTLSTKVQAHAAALFAGFSDYPDAAAAGLRGAASYNCLAEESEVQREFIKVVVNKIMSKEPTD